MQSSREYTPPPPLSANPQAPALRVFAFVFSVLLHPLFIPTLGIAYLAFVQQGYFTGMVTRDRSLIILRVAVNTIFFPLVAVLLLKGLGFIKSVFLQTQKERIIPFVASNIFYFWMFLVFKNQPEVPPIATSFMLGIFLASSAGLLFNSFFKISMHALGMGTICGILFCILFSGSPDSTFLPLMIVLLLTGIVCTSRLILSDHSSFDIYSGLLIGIICQMAAWLFYF